MNEALAATALLMGLAGAPHCAAMCGSACAALGGSLSSEGHRSSALALHAGRLAGYAAVGAALAAGLAAVGAASQSLQMLRPVWAMAQGAALALGLWLMWQGRQPAWVSDFGSRRVAASGPQTIVWGGAPARAAVAGSLWAALPCGLLQSALVVAALGNGAAEGAALMLIFGLASGLGLLAAPALWNKLQAVGGPSWRQAATRLSGGLLAGAAGWSLWHLTLAVPAAEQVCR
jgi:sulfite exporter TauE/SafE